MSSFRVLTHNNDNKKSQSAKERCSHLILEIKTLLPQQRGVALLVPTWR